MLNFFDTPFDIVTSAALWLCGAVVIWRIAQGVGTSMPRMAAIYIYHSLFCVIATAQTRAGNVDAVTYYMQAQEGMLQIGLGTFAIPILAYGPIQIFGLSYFGANLSFAIIGCIGIVLMDRVLNLLAADQGRFIRFGALAFVFIPSLHFWTATIGKDSLMILATGLILWFAVRPSRRIWLLIAAVLIMLIARPHMAILFLIAVVIAGLSTDYFSWRMKGVVLLVGGVIMAMTLPITLAHFGLGQGNGDILEFLKSRQDVDVTRRGQSFINPDMAMPLRIFTFMFRPLGWEADTLHQWIVSVENMTLLGAIGGVCLHIRNIGGSDPLLPGKFLIVLYALLSWLLLAYVTYNLGLASRQKWMVLPFVMGALVAMSRRPDRGES